MEKNKTKTVFFSEIPDSIWKKIEPQITKRYSNEVKEYYTRFGEAYLRKNRPDNDDFYGFNACNQRLQLVILDFTDGSFHCTAMKNESGFATIREDGTLICFNFVDLHYDFLRDLFKMIDFLAKKPEFTQFYDYAYELTGGTITANVLMNYSNLFAAAPIKNNLEGAKELEKKLCKKYVTPLPAELH